MCSQKITWAIARSDKTNVPVCNQHMGPLLEVIYKSDGPTFGFMYVGDRDVKVTCAWADQGKQISLESKADVLTKATEVDESLTIGTTASAEIVNP